MNNKIKNFKDLTIDERVKSFFEFLYSKNQNFNKYISENNFTYELFIEMLENCCFYDYSDEYIYLFFLKNNVYIFSFYLLLKQKEYV